MTKWNSGLGPQLQAFRALYEEGSVVGAARTLGLTQSAVSKQLAQLRTRFDDALFVKTVNGMLPTPQAIALQPRITRILEDLESLEGAASTEPLRFTGTFRMMATDEILLRLLPGLDARLRAEAPNLRLTTLPLSEDYGARDLETGQVNMVIAVNWHAPGHLRQRLLFRDRFVCVVHAEHQLASAELSAESYCAFEHVLIAPLGHEASLIDAALRQEGLSRRIALSVASFGLLTPELLGTDRLVTLPSGVAQGLVQKGDFIVKNAPIDLPPIDYFALWHVRFQQDEKIGWMLQVLKDCLKGSDLFQKSS